MCRLFKSRVAGGVAGLLAVCASAEEGIRDLAWYSNAVQNVVSYEGEGARHQAWDLFGGEAAPVVVSDKGALTFNDEPTTLERLAGQLKGSDLICLNSVDFGKQNGMASELAEIIALIGETGVDERFINLNMEYLPKEKSTDCDTIKIASDGALSFKGNPVELSDLSGLLSADRKVGIESTTGTPPPFSTLLEVVQIIGPGKVHHIFAPNRGQQIQISAEIYQLNAAGNRDVLSAPRMTTQAGYGAMMRVVENASGWQNYKPELDDFHQEDLANLGIRFSATPQILGDYIRVGGTIVLTKSNSRRQEMFQQGAIPIYSYSVTKTVAPFYVVLPIHNDGVEFPVADMDGIETRCRLSATLVDEKGMTRADREKARAMERP